MCSKSGPMTATKHKCIPPSFLDIPLLLLFQQLQGDLALRVDQEVQGGLSHQQDQSLLWVPKVKCISAGDQEVDVTSHTVQYRHAFIDFF